MRMRVVRGWLGVMVALAAFLAATPRARADISSAEVSKAIRAGVGYLRSIQDRDGSWNGQPGTTELVILALLTAGESPKAPYLARAIQLSANQPLDHTYGVALQTMALAAADKVAHRDLILRNADWLMRAQQVENARGLATFGAWSYTLEEVRGGDNSNTQYAVLGLHAASEAGVKIPPPVWNAARDYWLRCQQRDGGWQYHPQPGQSTGSMTTAGISSLVISGMGLFRGGEQLDGAVIRHCGTGSINVPLERAAHWLGVNFRVDTNINSPQWKLYYLYGLERAGRLTGMRYFGGHDWYLEGADELVRTQDRFTGAWEGSVLSTSFALLFLAKGRAPVLINKLRHAPGNDWNNDPDDVRNLVDVVSAEWKHLLTWQVVDPESARVEELMQAPIIYLNGHKAPLFSVQAKRRLREYVEQGGFILADACCGMAEFDRGFREMMKQVFPEPEYELKPLADEHPIWNAHWRLEPDSYRLDAIDFGCRTVVLYSRDDLSCYWNMMTANPQNHAVIKGRMLGQNVVDYVTGREMPADKLQPRELAVVKFEPPKRGALHIAKLRHAGDWNVAPLAIPHLTTALRERRGFDVVINHKDILPSDPNLVNYPLVYIHGRAALSFNDEELAALRRHLEPGGGTIFADAACGSTVFDAAFRKFVAQLFPSHSLEPIPPEDDLYTLAVGYDLSNVEFTKAAGGKRGRPLLEGVKINGHWAVIYSKLDIGCAMQRLQGIDCKGYSHESALKIATNIVIYATLP